MNVMQTATCEAPRQESVRATICDVDDALCKATSMAERIDVFLAEKPGKSTPEMTEVHDMMSQCANLRDKARWLCEVLYSIMQTLGTEG